MNATTPKPVLAHDRERAGEHVRYMAGVRARIAKQGGDALGDVTGGDLDKAPRLPPHTLPAIVTGGEACPG